jgi:hypothetical protein
MSDDLEMSGRPAPRHGRHAETEYVIDGETVPLV